MLLYEDILTGDEIFSDAFPVCVLLMLFMESQPLLKFSRKEVDDIVFEIDCQMTVVKGDGEINIGVICPRMTTNTGL